MLVFDMLFCGHWVAKDGQGVLRENEGNPGRNCVEEDDHDSGRVVAVSVRVMVPLVVSVGDTCSLGVVWLWQCRLRYW